MDGSTRLARRASMKHVVVIIRQEIIICRVIVVFVFVQRRYSEFGDVFKLDLVKYML